jgi:hypothetical protein
MAVQVFGPSMRRFHEDHKPSFWQQLFQGLVVVRQQEANEYVAEYLRRHEEYQENRNPAASCATTVVRLCDLALLLG